MYIDRLLWTIKWLAIFIKSLLMDVCNATLLTIVCPFISTGSGSITSGNMTFQKVRHFFRPFASPSTTTGSIFVESLDLTSILGSGCGIDDFTILLPYQTIVKHVKRNFCAEEIGPSFPCVGNPLILYATNKILNSPFLNNYVLSLKK